VEPSQPAIHADECFRCGYNLFGITDDQACPECGLLAIRSRRITDELHYTRPRWLKSIFWGLCLILTSVILLFVWPLVLPYLIFVLYADSRMSPHGLLYTFEPIVLFGPSAILLAIGAIRLTCREGYAPADRADYKRRWALRVAAFVPLSVLVVIYHNYLFNMIAVHSFSSFEAMLVAECFVLVLTPLPPLLFLQLRSLAKRARCQYLPHDCLVVGFGVPILAMSVVAYGFVSNNPRKFGLTDNGNSNVSLAVVLCMVILSFGFVLWTLYLLINFAIAFRKAAAEAKKKWLRDDLSLSHAEMPK
jgi:hypothetical protein